MFVRLGDLNRTFWSLDDFRRRMDRLFDEYSTGSGRTGYGSNRWPTSQFFDNGESVVLKADVPGLSENDIRLSVNQNVLTLIGERKIEAPEGYSTHRRERSGYSFSRSYEIPYDIDVEKTVATVKDGVLSVQMPKAESALPKQIKVNVE